MADDIGPAFGGTKAKVETCEFIDHDGFPMSWTIRSNACRLLVSGGAHCDGCVNYRGNLRAKASYHSNGGRALKVDPNSHANLDLVSSELLKERCVAEHKLRKDAEERERALKKKIDQLEYVEVDVDQHKSFTDLLKSVYADGHSITDTAEDGSPSLALLMTEQMKRIENDRAVWHPLVLKWALTVYDKVGRRGLSCRNTC